MPPITLSLIGATRVEGIVMDQRQNREVEERYFNADGAPKAGALLTPNGDQLFSTSPTDSALLAR